MRVNLGTRRSRGWIFLACLILLVVPDLARTQPYEVPETWGGDIWSRPRLTGNWGGSRDDLAKMGVVFDIDLLLTRQDVVSGGRSTGGDLWGNIDYTLNIDTQNLGLWPGGFFKFQADTGSGSNVFKDAGTLVPVNTVALIPGINENSRRSSPA
jgi:porin